jgi:DNA-binding response OmpR family regulator
MKEKKILIVDDEVSILKLLNLSFTRAGYQVFTAESGEEALELLKKETIHVMFFDLNLPNMDGLELCRKVKHYMPMAIIYAITGYASLFHLAECLEAGFEDYFKKPVNIATLIKRSEDAFTKVERWKRL